jgi:hypothetical protein
MVFAPLGQRQVASGYRGEAQIAEERSDEGGGLRFGRGGPRQQTLRARSEGSRSARVLSGLRQQRPTFFAAYWAWASVYLLP